MKKRILLLSGLGVAGGLLYALETQHKRNKKASASDGLPTSGNGRGRTDSNLKQGEERRPAASMARLDNRVPKIAKEEEHPIDDQGTHQAEASQILKHIRDNAFEASDEKLALALGRPTDEIEEWTSGRGLIDGDVILKARALAMQRGFEI